MYKLTVYLSMGSSSLFNYSTIHILKQAFVTSVTCPTQTQTKPDYQKIFKAFCQYFQTRKSLMIIFTDAEMLQYIRFDLLVANSCRRCCFNSVSGTCAPYNSTVYLPNGSPCSTGYCSGVCVVLLLFMHLIFQQCINMSKYVNNLYS